MSVVLVHGAWHGAWAWDGVVRELAAAGIGSEAVELPFTGLADDAATVRAAIERAGSDAVVCGHSYGGFVISAAARATDAAHLVYLCAFMADVDEDPWTPWFAHPVPLHEATVVVEGQSTVDPAKARECFYADADEDVIAEIVPRLRSFPIGGAPVDHAAPAWHEIDSTYVVCRRDQAIHPEVQRMMARHATNVVEWDADHSPFVSQPAVVATLLADLQQAASAPAGRGAGDAGNASRMTRPELARGGDNPIGENTPPGDPDERTNQAKDTIAPMPEDNAPGHSPEHDQDKPIEKFAARFGNDAEQ